MSAFVLFKIISKKMNTFSHILSSKLYKQNNQPTTPYLSAFMLN